MANPFLQILNPFLGKQAFQSFFRKLYYLSLRGMNYSSTSKYHQNGEDHVLRRINQFYGQKEELVIFDVGANVGDYSSLIFNIFGDKNYNVHAFEPVKSTFGELSGRITSDNFHLNNLGLSSEEKKIQIHYDTDASKLSSVYKRKLDHTAIGFDKTETIKVSTIDLYSEQNNIEKIEFLKVDVEGHELEVFKGAVSMIESKSIDFIQFEFGGTNIDSRTYFKDLYYALGPSFKLYRIVRDGLVPIDQYSEIHEVFQSCNYLAIRKEIDFR
ncbi:MAG: FkbM family methyltransferase [Cyclobacteriaceae bacterium]